MKLAVTLALATLALCCRPESCLDFIVKTFFVSLLSSHEVSVELFSPDADMRDAAIKIKGLVDTLPQQDRDSVRRAMVRASLLGGGFPKSLRCIFGTLPSSREESRSADVPGEEGWRASSHST
ncbi:Uteroglobin [Myotis brandtii]|uniref:Uteroglobin n=1 Tax=Myotis brandtii TaxID=109478 RepID=S7MDC0_MYOBR|nr:Uteroglobin [Myotis brandtii]